MQILQRSFSILLVVFFLIFAVTLVFNEKEENGYVQWEKIQVNRFLEQINSAGKYSYREYLLLHEALSRLGRTVEITIKEYQKETDAKGTVYWYFISWEEMKDVLLEKEEYIFQKNSAIEVCIITKIGSIQKEERYYILFKGKERGTYLKRRKMLYDT